MQSSHHHLISDNTFYFFYFSCDEFPFLVKLLSRTCNRLLFSILLQRSNEYCDLLTLARHKLFTHDSKIASWIYRSFRFINFSEHQLRNVKTLSCTDIIRLYKVQTHTILQITFLTPHIRQTISSVTNIIKEH